MARAAAKRQITVGPDFDPKAEKLRDRRGNLVTEATLARAVEDAEAAFERRQAGRPALGTPGTRAPSLTVRVPRDLKVQIEERARDEGRRPSDVVRDAVTRYLRPPARKVPKGSR